MPFSFVLLEHHFFLLLALPSRQLLPVACVRLPDQYILGSTKIHSLARPPNLFSLNIIYKMRTAVFIASLFTTPDLDLHLIAHT